MTRQEANPLYNTGTFALYDSNTLPTDKNDHFAHFALTDTLIQYAGERQQPILHFWQTPPLAILGMMDTKIGHFEEALAVFSHHNHDYIVRNSGGLGIISDPGVLNVSLIYPNDGERLPIDAAYHRMLQFLRATFYPHFTKKIEAYEIPNSYCFGDYDLSIDGRKIAGIAQRRLKNGIAIMAYISVKGDQLLRGEMMKAFYERGLDGSEPAGRYPNVAPEVMTTLEEAYGTTLTVAEVKERMRRQFDWVAGDETVIDSEAYEEGLSKMHRRNARVFGDDFLPGS